MSIEICKILGTALQEGEVKALSIRLGLSKVPKGEDEEEFINCMHFDDVFNPLKSFLLQNFGLDLAPYAYETDGVYAIIGVIYNTHKYTPEKFRHNYENEYHSIDQFLQTRKEKKAEKKIAVPVKLFSDDDKQKFLFQLLKTIHVEPTLIKFTLKNY